MKRFLSLSILSALILAATPALAQTSGTAPAASALGGCNANGKVCWGPELTLTLTTVDLRNGHVDGGFDPGAGYGFKLFKGQPYEIGVAVYAVFQTGPEQKAMISVIGSFDNYLRFGWGRSPVGPNQDPFLLFGIGSSI